MFGRMRAPGRRIDAELSCSFCGQSQQRARKLLAGAQARICSACVGQMMGLFYGADRPLFDDIVDTAARRAGGDPTACRGQVETYAATYADARGEAPASLDNDGETLSLKVRGVAFAGPDFDSLSPAAQAPADLGRFEMRAGALCGYRLAFNIPLPLAIGCRTIAASLSVELEIARAESAPRTWVCVTLQFEGASIAAEGPHADFAAALTALRARLPAAVTPKACAACAFSAYNPSGHGLYGALMCFRGLKRERLAAQSPAELAPLLGRQDRFVQETWLCPDWQRAAAAPAAACEDIALVR